MPIENYDIVGSYNNQRVKEIDAERSINCFPYYDPLSKGKKTLLGTSGLINQNINFGSISGGFRAEYVFLGNHYAVIGNTVVSIANNNTFSILGFINTNAGYVGISANTFQVIFVDGVDGWVWDTNTTTFTQITDSNFPEKPIDVDYLDGFLIIANGDTNKFRLSQINNALSYTPLQEGPITSGVGTIVACRVLHRRLFLFSQNFTEVWENAGIGTNLPFRRNNSLLMEYGTPSIGSIAVGFDKMFFLSQDRDGLGAVMEVGGTQSVPVSTRALDFQLSQYAANNQVSDCRAFLIKENGIIFYRMNFTEANHTFVYDVTQSNFENEETKLWHEEEMLNGSRHIAQTHAYFNGKNYVGHFEEPILYELSASTYTNDGEAIKRTRIGRPQVPGGFQRTRIDRFQLDFLQGSPVIYETDTPVPLVFLSISKDGGQSYGTVLPAPMGTVGDRTFRTLWRKLGVIPRGQAFVPKIEFYNEIPFVLLGAAWFYEVLPE